MAKSIKPKHKRSDRDVPSGPRAIANVTSKDVYDWIEHKISQADPKTGVAICPFAKKTIAEKKIQVVPGKSNLVDQIHHCCNLFDSLALDCVVIYVQYKITESQLQEICSQAHQNNSKYAILYDHPDNDGLHKGVSFSFGKCPLIMIQSLSQLKDAQSKLRRTAYYRIWGLDPDDGMFY